MTYDQILSTLLGKIPEPMFQQSYAAHMAAIVEVLHVQLAAAELPAVSSLTPELLEASSRLTLEVKPAIEVSEWREPDDLPEEGDLIEIELASGELLRGEVSEIEDDEKMDVELTGAEAAPKIERGVHDSWWTTSYEDWDDDNERRVRWRKLDKLPEQPSEEPKSVKLEGEGFDADGRPPIGARVEIKLASGDTVSGIVTSIDRASHERLDVEIRTDENPDGNPGHWWTGENSSDDRDRRVAIKILEAPSNPATRSRGCGG